MRVKISQVSRIEPSIVKCSSRRIGTVPVALHYHGAAHGQFSNGWPRFLRLRINDLAFDALHRLAAGSDRDVVRPVDINRRCSLGQTESLHDIDAEIVKVFLDDRIEPRPPGCEITHLRPKRGMDFLKENGSCVYANF